MDFDEFSLMKPTSLIMTFFNFFFEILSTPVSINKNLPKNQLSERNGVSISNE